MIGRISILDGPCPGRAPIQGGCVGSAPHYLGRPELPTSGGFDGRGIRHRRPSRTGQPLAGGGHGSFMPSHRYPGEGQRQRSAKCPLFDPTCPPFEHDRPDHGLTARRADRAVLIEFRRFLAGIRAILATPDKREVGGSTPPGPIFLATVSDLSPSLRSLTDLTDVPAAQWFNRAPVSGASSVKQRPRQGTVLHQLYPGPLSRRLRSSPSAPICSDLTDRTVATWFTNFTRAPHPTGPRRWAPSIASPRMGAHAGPPSFVVEVDH